MHSWRYDDSTFSSGYSMRKNSLALTHSSFGLGLLIDGGASALITNITLESIIIPLAKEMCILCHILFTFSTMMLSLFAYFPTYLKENTESNIDDVDIPGIYYIQKPLSFKRRMTKVVCLPLLPELISQA
ncbi:hypothetical protein GUJ93_ZPchr0008g12865 [Zizania palustris]|uniref:Uncharacterized protein n=1 Tax=Zizania palustris TaxID=103762 RepID=A0A8J5V5B8_ZIZPA|nr:hypothetical protein GUJ93_ZPchr0008g12865 [Zizania palustris]